MSDKICARCPSRDRLELDHLDPTKKVTHNIWSWSQARRDAEIAKCQILCHDCHKAKTLAMRRKAQHGSAQMYQVYKCRCTACRSWRAASDKKYRLAKKQPNLSGADST